ncbi:MAG: hypothetical protein BGO01_10475 [Armatimonadetes bacterium 55-13]|nr:hypothetical protein [Armatimonadota bacterium]OJU62823.1 MAG: hypothetical protein BGO01_10475 [Armatimonadetes bacterium 55-13]
MRSEVLSSSMLGMIQWNMTGNVQLTFGNASIGFLSESEFEGFADFIAAEFLRNRLALDFDVRVGWLTISMPSDMFENFHELVKQGVSTLRLMRGSELVAHDPYNDLLWQARRRFGTP